MSDGKQAPQNIQDAFLNTVRREKTSVVVYLLNGAKLTGRIRSFDKFSVLLESGSQEQLIFKHAISTISQSRRATGELHSQASAETNPREVRSPMSTRLRRDIRLHSREHFHCKLKRTCAWNFHYLRRYRRQWEVDSVAFTGQFPARQWL